MLADRVLTVKFPWTAFIAARLKPLETRRWTTSYRGYVWIHTARMIDEDALRVLGMPLGYDERRIGLERGRVICRAQLDFVRPMTPADEPAAMCPWERGRYVFGLSDVRRVRPFPLRGQLGLFEAQLPDFESIMETSER